MVAARHDQPCHPLIDCVLQELRDMPEWTAQTPLRVVTGYQAIAQRFFEEKGFKHFVLLAADGALEAHPAMGSADIILDLVRV
jgi:ATP phosphoribosyltransferase